MTCPPDENPFDSTRVKGHGPARHDRRVFRNSRSGPASSENGLIVAFHRPSGEHGGVLLQGVLGVLTMSKVRAALATSWLVAVLKAYLTRTFAMATSGFPGVDVV